MNHGVKTTSKGTELPLLDLRGKPYLQVAHRLVWYREECPAGEIKTELCVITPDYCVVKATVTNNEGRVVATGHKREDGKSYADYVEKAETGAIGRALGAAGYGTQFEPSFDEEERLADSPISIPTKETKKLGNSGTKGHKTVETKIAQIPSASSNGVKSTEVLSKDNGNTKTRIEEAYSKLKETGKTTSVEFTKKYLGGIGLSKMAPQIMEDVLSRIKTDFPDLTV